MNRGDRDWTFESSQRVWGQLGKKRVSPRRERERACTRFIFYFFSVEIIFLFEFRKERKEKKGQIWKKKKREKKRKRKKKRAISAGSAVWRPLNTAIIISLNVQSYRDSCGNHRFFVVVVYVVWSPSPPKSLTFFLFFYFRIWRIFIPSKEKKNKKLSPQK